MTMSKSNFKVTYTKVGHAYKTRAMEIHKQLLNGSLPMTQDNVTRMALHYEMAFTYILTALASDD